MARGDIKTFTVTEGGVTLTVNAIDLGNGQVKFDIINTGSVSIDVNALYFGDGLEHGKKEVGASVADKSLNMNGTKEFWNDAVQLSSSGLAGTGADKATFLTAGESYATVYSTSFDDIVNLGVRGTSVGGSGGNSIKAVGQVDDAGGDGIDGDHLTYTAPHVSISDAPDVMEGGVSVFTISLDHAYAYDITVGYQSADDSAHEGRDYDETHGTIVIKAGQTSVTVEVQTKDDSATPGDVHETKDLLMQIVNATADIHGTEIAVGVTHDTGIGNILDPDDEDQDDDGGGTTPPEHAHDVVDTAFLGDHNGNLSFEVIYFDTDGNGTADYVVKVENFGNGQNSADHFQDILDALVTKGQVASDSEVVGVVIHAGGGSAVTYYSNPGDPDGIAPNIAGLEQSDFNEGHGNVTKGATYNYGDLVHA
jgi:hypothetical protein